MRPTSDDTPRGVALDPAELSPHKEAGLDYQFGEEISGASWRLRALAALSGSLTDALSPEEAATLVQQKALSALGASSAVVVTFGPPLGSDPSRPSDVTGPKRLTVLHAIGLPVEVRAALDQLPLDAPVPLAEVARTGQPLFFASKEALREYRDWGPTMIRGGSGAAAVVPVWANGELRGVLGLAWPRARTFDEDERAFVLTLGVMCAQAIMRAHLRAAELKAREDAEEANRSKARFVATVSHELRTPMNAVLGYTALLADEIYGPLSPLQRDHISRVRTSGAHLMGLIEDLLGHARLDAGEEIVRLDPVSLTEIVERSLVLVRPMAEQKGLRLSVEGFAEPLTLHTDARKLCQILVNLLGNAVKFTESGGVTLLVRVEGPVADVRVHFEVTDTGGGIPLLDHEHIFEPFWQADTETARASGSTGLGLSVARRLARLLGGEVAVAASAPERGSTFVLSVPANATPAAA
jgi:signal transduction histidine kinase